MKKVYQSTLDGLYKRKMIDVLVTDEHPNYPKGVITFTCSYVNNGRDAGRIGYFKNIPKDIIKKVKKDFCPKEVNNPLYNANAKTYMGITRRVETYHVSQLK